MSDRERVKTALDEMLKYYDAQLNWEGTDVWANELLALIQPSEPVAWEDYGFTFDMVPAMCGVMSHYKKQGALPEVMEILQGITDALQRYLTNNPAPQPEREREANPDDIRACGWPESECTCLKEKDHLASPWTPTWKDPGCTEHGKRGDANDGTEYNGPADAILSGGSEHG